MTDQAPPAAPGTTSPGPASAGAVSPIPPPPGGVIKSPPPAPSAPAPATPPQAAPAVAPPATATAPTTPTTPPVATAPAAPASGPPAAADGAPSPATAAPAPRPAVVATAEGGATIDPDSYARAARAIENEIHNVIVGQENLVRSLLVAMLCEGHVLLEGVPGLGKTQLLKTLAQVTGLPFARIQFTPDLMPADILGTYILVEEEGHRRFDFRAGPVFACLVLADEVNRGTPKVQSALLEAMAERTATVGGRTWALPRPFLVMATQNPIEMEGTYPLPEAQLDRFFFKLSVPFPPASELEAILERTTDAAPVTVQRLADGRLLNAMIALTRTVVVPRHVRRYAADLVVATHPQGPRAPKEVDTYVRFGASPRGGQALVMAAKAAALLDGRPNASISDVRDMAPAALRHRLVLGYEAAADAVGADVVVDAVLAAVPEPAG